MECSIFLAPSNVQHFSNFGWCVGFFGKTNGCMNFILLGIPGAFHSLLTPEFTVGMEGFLFMEYFIAHGGIILNALLSLCF
jgi:uncharacterized membrane protein YwaF